MRINPWKISTLVLTGVLALVLTRDSFAVAEAAGPKRLSAALSALKSSKKHLEEAKDPPAGFHTKSIASVDQAIAAVEREIKALEDAQAKAKAKGETDKDKPKDKDAKKGDKSAKETKSDKKPAHHEAATEVDD